MKDIDDDAIFLLKKEVENKMGFSLKAPTNFDALISRVLKETGETLSVYIQVKIPTLYIRQVNR